MKRKLLKKSAYFLMYVVLITGCNLFLSNTEYVKNSVWMTDYSMKVGDALDNYKYFTKTEWKEFTTDRGKEIVEFNGYYFQKNIIVRIQFSINKDRRENEEGASINLSYEGYKFINQSDDKSESYSSLLSAIYENKEISYFSWLENPEDENDSGNSINQTLQENNYPSDFIDFIDNFSTNAQFQLSHVLFPLSNGGLETPAPTKEEWQFINEDYFFDGIKTSDDGAEFHGKFEIINPNKISYGVGQPESEWIYYLVFQKIEGTWLLVEYIDFDMQP